MDIRNTSLGETLSSPRVYFLREAASTSRMEGTWVEIRKAICAETLFPLRVCFSRAAGIARVWWNYYLFH